jgi:[ribosomal protein S5]-alanine N-acetyltransferase
MKSRPPVKVRIEPASGDHEGAFLAAVRRSTALHHPWVSAPRTPARFRRYISQHTGDRHLSYFAFSQAGELVGVVNVSEIVRGVFHSAFLGYCAFVPHQRHGYMTAALKRVVTECFGKHGLHRLEANIQPENRRSVQLVKRLGFRKEGYSERYLKIGGRWRDHERWAITRERWKELARLR